jgi:hypothetical protein
MKYVPSEDIILALIDMLEDARDSQFAVGDLLVKEVDIHGVPKSEIFKVIGGALGVSSKTLYAYEATARRWDYGSRQTYKNLDWTFYKESDPNNAEDRLLLDAAIDENKTAGWLMSQKYKKSPVYYLANASKQLGRIIQQCWEEEQKITQEQADVIYEVLDKVNQILDQIDEENE